MSLLAGVPAALGRRAARPRSRRRASASGTSGPLPIRGYALCILAGIVVAVWLTQKRLEARGHRKGIAIDISAWAVPFGIVGGRLYHLITTPQPYFGENGDPWKAFAIYEGGLGIWGAVALGAVGAWIGCRKNGVAFRDFVDAAAPGLAIAQAMGRFGNWFNNEIYGAPDRPAVEAAHLRVGHLARPRRRRRPGQPRRQGLLPPDVPLRGALVPAARGLPHLARPPSSAQGRPGLRRLRHGLPGRPHRHREHAHRLGQPHPRPARQHLGLDPRVPARRLPVAALRPDGAAGRHRRPTARSTTRGERTAASRRGRPRRTPSDAEDPSVETAATGRTTPSPASRRWTVRRSPDAFCVTSRPWS